MSNTENTEKKSVGSAEMRNVRIATDVIARIGGIAALDVNGVVCMAGNLSRKAISKVGKNYLKNGVKVSLNGKNADIALSLVMGFGYNIPEVCREVQTKVSGTIANMTGLNVSNVDVNVAGIVVQDNE